MAKFKFKAADKVKRIHSSHEGMKVGDIGVVKSFENSMNMYLEGYRFAHDPGNFELFVVDEKESTAKWLKENRWFIRTGTKEKSKLVQEWLFEHGCEWLLMGKNLQSDFNDKLLTNTNCDGEQQGHIMFSCSTDKTNAQEIVLEFQTTVKSVKLPEEVKPTEQQLKIAELGQTIANAQEQVAKLKEEM